MTNEKMLEILQKLVKSDAINADIVNQYSAVPEVLDETSNLPHQAEAILTNAIKQLKKDIITAEAKKSGNGMRQKAIDSLCKDMTRKADSVCEPRYAQQHKSKASGKYYITDGYTAVESDIPFSGITEQTANPIDIARCCTFKTTKTFDLPSASALKAWIKSEKANGNTVPKGGRKSGVLLDFGENAPAFDAEFILRAIQITNGTAKTIAVNDNLTMAILTADDGMRVVLCAVRPFSLIKRRDCLAEIKYLEECGK